MEAVISKYSFTDGKAILESVFRYIQGSFVLSSVPLDPLLSSTENHNS